MLRIEGGRLLLDKVKGDLGADKFEMTGALGMDKSLNLGLLLRLAPERVRAVEIGRGSRLGGCVAHHESTFRTDAYSLTGQDFPNYSVAMEAELNALEERIRQAAELCQRLRTENTDLRQRLAKLESDNKRLGDKINGAKERLEGLLRQMPE